jgi:hypothetical protein
LQQEQNTNSFTEHWQKEILKKMAIAKHGHFESGFTGFRGLTITSLVWVERLLLNGVFITKPLADA